MGGSSLFRAARRPNYFLIDGPLLLTGRPTIIIYFLIDVHLILTRCGYTAHERGAAADLPPGSCGMRQGVTHALRSLGCLHRPSPCSSTRSCGVRGGARVNTRAQPQIGFWDVALFPFFRRSWQSRTVREMNSKEARCRTRQTSASHRRPRWMDE